MLARAKFHAKRAPEPAADAAVVSQDMLRSIRQECEKQPTAKAAVMGQKDIERMRQAAKIETAEDIKQKTLVAQ
jgi:hypothetical protein